MWFLTRHEAAIYLMLDNNPAGRDGALKAADRLLSRVERLYFVEYSTSQPSDLTIEEVQNAIKAAPTFHTWSHQKFLPSQR
jgi:hypothetical protein